MTKPIDLPPMLIDSRVGSAELKPHINSGIRTELTRLEYADVSFIGNGPDQYAGVVNIGIERKTIGDLISSIDSGRLSGHQLMGLLNSYHYVYLLVEGYWRSSPVNGLLETKRGKGWMPYGFGKRSYMAREVNNYLNTLAIKCNIRIWRTNDITQSGKWLQDLYAWWQKSWEGHTSHQQFHEELEPVAQLTQPTPMESMLKAGVKGLGWKKAQQVAAIYPNMLDLVMADKKDLMAIPGIGKTQAQKIIDTLIGGKV